MIHLLFGGAVQDDDKSDIIKGYYAIYKDKHSNNKPSLAQIKRKSSMEPKYRKILMPGQQDCPLFPSFAYDYKIACLLNP